MSTFPVELPVPPANRARQARAWQVLHACENANDAVCLTEAQLGVGMRPRVLAREFWSSGKEVESPSLLNAWHAVRDWRQALNEAEALTSLQIVHSHSFAAAMAGVRGTLPCVFDFQQTIEETPAAGNGAGPWVLRSFRVAEQFALSRAGAVVTHAETMRAVAHERGAAAENLFVVPEPVETRTLIADQDWAALHGIDLAYHAAIFAAPAAERMEPALRAFATVLSELEQAVLIFELGGLDRHRLLSVARDLEVADNIRCIAAEERLQAIACASTVLVGAPLEQHRASPLMLQAMAAGKAVVAANVAANRECSSESRGVIWFREGDVQDMAQRTAFVARNADFSRSLGESGQLLIRSSRAPQVIGRLYEDVYAHAHSRRRDNLPRIPVPKLYEANVQI